MGTDTGLTPLHVAVDACALEAVRCVADDGFDVNAVIADGSTVLHCLVSSKSRMLSCEVVESLLAKGADPCKSRAEGRTTLHVLTEWDHHFEETRLPVLQRLADSATTLDQINAEGMTLLHQVCDLEPSEKESSLDLRTQAPKALLGNGADPQCLDQSGRTAFQLLVDLWEEEFWETVTSETKPFFRACAERAEIFFNKTARSGAALEHCSPPPHLLCLSIYYHFEGLTNELLEHSPDVDANAYQVAGETPFQAARFRGCSLSPLIRKLFQGSNVRADSRARGSKLIH